MYAKLFQILYRLTEKGLYYTAAKYPNYADNYSERAQNLFRNC